jgi:hypothetical protein
MSCSRPSAPSPFIPIIHSSFDSAGSFEDFARINFTNTIEKKQQPNNSYIPNKPSPFKKINKPAEPAPDMRPMPKDQVSNQFIIRDNKTVIIVSK